MKTKKTPQPKQLYYENYVIKKICTWNDRSSQKMFFKYNLVYLLKTLYKRASMKDFSSSFHC
jgi:hypothetical protein